jgi:hypothetical protein
MEKIEIAMALEQNEKKPRLFDTNLLLEKMSLTQLGPLFHRTSERNVANIVVQAKASCGMKFSSTKALACV